MACLGAAEDVVIDGGGAFTGLVALVWPADGGNFTTGAGCVGNGAEIADLLAAVSGMRGGLFTGAGLVGGSTLAGSVAAARSGAPGIGDAVTFDADAILFCGSGTGIGFDNSADAAAGVAFASTTGTGVGRATQRPPAMATATADRPAATGQRFRPAVPIT